MIATWSRSVAVICAVLCYESWKNQTQIASGCNKILLYWYFNAVTTFLYNLDLVLRRPQTLRNTMFIKQLLNIRTCGIYSCKTYSWLNLHVIMISSVSVLLFATPPPLLLGSAVHCLLSQIATALSPAVSPCCSSLIYTSVSIVPHPEPLTWLRLSRRWSQLCNPHLL